MMIVLVTIGGFSLASPQPAEASIIPKCTVSLLGDSNNLAVTCVNPQTGVTLGPSQIDLSVLGNQVVVTVPGPTTTQTVTVPGPTATATATVRVPGPTQTVRPAPIRTTTTVRPAPVRVTETATTVRTVTPAPVRITTTRTVTPEPKTVTETATITAEPAPRQEPPTRGTMEDDRGFFSGIDIDDGDITAAEAGLGVVSLLALILTGLFVLYAGYLMGWRSGKADADEEEAHFMRSLLESSKLRK